MSRPLRVEYEDAIYHVINRGDRREPIFADDTDRETFLRTLEQACAKTGWQIHAWCLMGNHFHLVIETSRPNLVSGMKWLLGTYTQRYHRRHRQSGHLFQGRYKAQLIDAESPGYLRVACDYVHWNPVRARLIEPSAPLERWRWSSYGDYLRAARARPIWLRVDRLLGEHGLASDDARSRRRFAQNMEFGRAEEAGTPVPELRRGWLLGAEDFLDRLVEQVTLSPKAHHPSGERRESAKALAARIVSQALAAEGSTEKDLPRLRKGDPMKVRIARQLREETTMTLQEIAERLHMGAASHVAHLLYQRIDERL